MLQERESQFSMKDLLLSCTNKSHPKSTKKLQGMRILLIVLCAFFEVFFHILNSFLSLLSWYFFIIQKYTQSNIPSLKQQLELYSNNLHVWTFFARNEKLFKNFMFKKINAGTNSFTDLHSLSTFSSFFLSFFLFKCGKVINGNVNFKIGFFCERFSV